MSNIAEYELKKAAYARLTSGSSKIIYPFYSQVPENYSYPYAQFGDVIIQADPVKQLWMEKLSLDFLAWNSLSSKMSGSDKTIIGILDAIITSITHSDSTMTFSPLIMSGFTTFEHKIDLYQTITDRDAGIKQGILRMIFWIQES